MNQRAAFGLPLFFIREVALEDLIHQENFGIRHFGEQIGEELHGFLRVIGGCGLYDLADLLAPGFRGVHFTGSVPEPIFIDTELSAYRDDYGI